VFKAAKIRWLAIQLLVAIEGALIPLHLSSWKTRRKPLFVCKKHQWENRVKWRKCIDAAGIHLRYHVGEDSACLYWSGINVMPLGITLYNVFILYGTHLCKCYVASSVIMLFAWGLSLF
jgi:hypothetical protein